MLSKARQAGFAEQKLSQGPGQGAAPWQLRRPLSAMAERAHPHPDYPPAPSEGWGHRAPALQGDSITVPGSADESWEHVR